MEVHLIRAGEGERSILSNLLHLYLHDFSEFDGSEVGEDGRFSYPYLSVYWKEEHRHAFLINMDGRLSGFVLVKKGSELAGSTRAMDVAEFFVLRGLRRRGVGRAAFQELVRQFPGPWTVRVQSGLESALAFWERVIADVAGGSIDQTSIRDGDRSWTIFRFHGAPSSGASAD